MANAQPMRFVHVRVVRDILDQNRRRVPVDPYPQLSLAAGARGVIRLVDLSRADLVRLIDEAGTALAALEPKR